MERYDRQIRVKEIGAFGQKKIRETTVLIVGVGAIGTYAAEMIVRMGFKRLVLIDRDFVELSNLQRQTLFTEADAEARLPKAYAAALALKQMNRDVVVDFVVDDANAESLAPFTDVNFVLDCTDNFLTRRFLNDWCREHEIPWIYTSCAGTYAGLMPIDSKASACLTCLIGEMPQTNEASCDIIGVHGALIPIVAGAQVSLLIKMMLDENFTYNTFYQIDNWQLSLQKIAVLKLRTCPSCGEKKQEQRAFSSQPIVLCGRDTVQFQLVESRQVDFDGIMKRLVREQLDVHRNDFLLYFDFEGYQLTVFKNGRVLVHGTDELNTARKIYHHFFN
ncbi:ThiF family adenylyltransferase [Listeria sp. ILCC792]|uniref:ThiF family adenylyltransferase n=1 Tax=Listeria sp. ILCC792 TaxID=1918331 RepID=UPI000B593613|nr:ThiF family adenylyltransferase [Listeria sp. ILCC792]